MRGERTHIRTKKGTLEGRNRSRGLLNYIYTLASPLLDTRYKKLYLTSVCIYRNISSIVLLSDYPTLLLCCYDYCAVETLEEFTFRANVTSYTVANLRPYTNYTLMLAAVTRAGRSEFSEKRVTTLESSESSHLNVSPGSMENAVNHAKPSKSVLEFNFFA